MMMTRALSLKGVSLALVAAVVIASCGGGGQASTPTPVPTPVSTPTPEPDPEPTPEATSCSPLPPPITRVRVNVHLRDRDYLTLDATPLVGPDPQYCASIGYTDGRSICPVRPEGDPQKEECESWAVGRAEDTGRNGPTWTREDGEYCTTFEETFCANHPDNQYALWVYCGGIEYVACAANKACGRLMTDKDQHLEKCKDAPGSTYEGSGT